MNELIFTLQIVVMSLFLMLAAKHRLLLSALVAVSICLADLMVIKQIPLFSLSSTGSEIYISIAIITLFILQEQKGKKPAVETLLGCLMWYCTLIALSQLHLAYAPSAFDMNSMAYYEIFHNNPQVFTGTLIALPISMLIGMSLFEYLALYFSRWPFWWRLWLSYLPTQLINTALFVFIGLLGLTHVPILNTAVGALLLKMLIFIAFIPAIVLVKKLILPSDLKSPLPS